MQKSHRSLLSSQRFGKPRPIYVYIYTHIPVGPMTKASTKALDHGTLAWDIIIMHELLKNEGTYHNICMQKL